MENMRAYILYNQGRFKEAEKELKFQLSDDPDNPNLLFFLAACLMEQNKDKEAAEIVETGLGQDANNDYGIYLKARIAFNKNDYSEAQKAIEQAIQLDPNNPMYYGFRGNIEIPLRRFEEALRYANLGLNIDPTHVMCLNIRTIALVKLNRKEEAYATIERTLEKDPENEFTHFNVGYTYLQHGEHEKALGHFREALRLDPNFEEAKGGMVEAMKAKYWFYRQFLKYTFFMEKLSARTRWALLIGAYLLVRLLSSLSPDNQAIQVVVGLIIFAYLLFALTSWLIQPISNLLLRFNAYGRYALTDEEIQSSNYVVITLGFGIIGGLICIFNFNQAALLMAITGVAMTIPLGSMYSAEKPKNKRFLVYYTVGLIILALVSIVASFFQWNSLGGISFVIFALAFFAYQWIANAMK